MLYPHCGVPTHDSLQSAIVTTCSHGDARTQLPLCASIAAVCGQEEMAAAVERAAADKAERKATEKAEKEASAAEKAERKRAELAERELAAAAASRQRSLEGAKTADGAQDSDRKKSGAAQTAAQRLERAQSRMSFLSRGSARTAADDDDGAKEKIKLMSVGGNAVAQKDAEEKVERQAAWRALVDGMVDGIRTGTAPTAHSSFVSAFSRACSDDALLERPGVDRRQRRR